MKVYHHNDLDGRCAAAIVKKYYGSEPIEFIEMDYKKDVDVEVIGLGEKIVIVDFSFKPEVMKKVMEKLPDIVWIDHHKTCESYDYFSQGLNGLRDLTNKGLSGCELTWKYFYPNTAIPEAVCLIGDYDSWRLSSSNSLKFYEAVKVIDNNPLSKEWDLLLSYEAASKVGELLKIGDSIINYRDNYCKSIMSMFGFETEIEGIKAYATNFYQFGSPGFVDNFKKYPICLAFIFDGKKFTVSLYSETVDVSEIAKKFGGGGHKGAAGFVCENLPFHK